MMRYCTLAFLMVMAVLLGACAPEHTVEQPKYPAIAELVKGLIQELEGQQVSVEKTAVLDGKREVKTIDSLNWKHELEPFLQADINKPSWQGLYDSTHTQDAAGSYTKLVPKAGQDLPVKELVVMKDPNGQYVRITARVVTLSALNDVERLLQLDFGPDATGKVRLASYELTGNQKVVFQQQSFFAIKGILMYPTALAPPAAK